MLEELPRGGGGECGGLSFPPPLPRGPGLFPSSAPSGGMAGAPWLWLAWLCLRLVATAAFNLDATSSLLKDGDKGSLFGFAVALHRQLSPEPAGWLLVGAPQAPALPGQGANRTGGLFACPLTPELSDCWRVPIDEGGEFCFGGGYVCVFSLCGHPSHPWLPTLGVPAGLTLPLCVCPPPL
uniref:Uncharacterized protein n=1 Tax=Calidris pygmaea TaxID=425635 RepID=A0A8C3JT10_9CHAR